MEIRITEKAQQFLKAQNKKQIICMILRYT